MTRERVLAAAVELADARGLSSLSMRRLGSELGVEAMSLYNHVESKDDLLDGITDLVVRRIDLPGDPDWKVALRRHAVSAHEVLLAHPWACNLALSPSRAVPASVRRADWILRRLREGGFSPHLTYHGFHALDAHILGFTLWQLGHGIADLEHLQELAHEFFRKFAPEEYPDLHAHARQHLEGVGADEPGAFELVLELILDGLERMNDVPGFG